MEIEQRGFLLIDLKNSLEIAVDLGVLKYAKFMKMYQNEVLDRCFCYKDLFLYEKTGDEIILTWSEAEKSYIALEAYQSLVSCLDRKFLFYKKKYNKSIEIRGGLVWGEVAKVTTKKGIIYWGACLGIAARLQLLCKKYNTSLLLEKKVKKHIKKYTMEVFFCSKMGSFSISKKKKKIKVYMLD